MTSRIQIVARQGGRCARLSIVALMLAVPLSAWLHAGNWSLDEARVLSGGGVAISPGGCLRMSTSIGQDTLGRSSDGDFVVVGGLWPGWADQGTDTLFHHGFEECQ